MSFGKARALDHVSLRVRNGEIRALLGENGSGKSTLIKILAGYHTPEPGARLWIGGEEVAFPLTSTSLKHVPLNFVHQDLGLISEMSIVDNFGAGRWRRERRVGLGRIRWRSERIRARRALATFGLTLDVDTAIRDLREGERAIVALARALSTTPDDVPSVLVLDEPTASLPRHEVSLLFDAIHTLREQRHGVLFVSHRLEEVRAIADSVSVLRDGRLVLDCDLANTTDEALVRAIVGHEIAPPAADHAPHAHAERVLSVQGISGRGVRDVSFDLHAGETVGLTGLAGMGHDTVPEILLGLVPLDKGKVVLGEHEHFKSPRDALRSGIAYLAPSRARGGCLMSATVTETMTMSTLGRYFRRGRIDRASERRDAVRLMDSFDVRPRQPGALMSSLSGGNQQKCLLAKLEHSGAHILLLHEPTHGVDVGAREQVLDGINEMKAAGRAIVAISNEYEDLERICDRVLIFADGRVRAELAGTAVTERAIAAACLQVSDPASYGVDDA